MKIENVEVDLKEYGASFEYVSFEIAGTIGSCKQATRNAGPIPLGQLAKDYRTLAKQLGT